jgi:uncharacterized membrane protein
MSKLVTYFARGCLALIPVLLTGYLVVSLVRTLDAWVGSQIPGLGILVTLAFITVSGFFVSHFVGRKLFEWFDHAMEQIPGISILYRSLRDLISALTGQTQSFGSPVMVRLQAESEARVLGFLTRRELPFLALPGYVAVYVPQAYNIAGQLYVVPQSWVTPVEVPPAELLTFVLSGGATALGERKSQFPPKPPSN